MAILPDDLTERESRAEAGDAPGEADSAAPSTKALLSRPGSGRGKGRKPRPPSLLPPAGPPPPARPALPIPAPALPAASPRLSIPAPDAAAKGVGAAPEISGSCPCAELGGPLQGGSGEEAEQRWLEACARGSETAVIWAALVWEPETLARTTAPTAGGGAERTVSFSSPRSDLSPQTWFSPKCQRGTFLLPFFPSFLHLRRVGEQGRGRQEKW